MQIVHDQSESKHWHKGLNFQTDEYLAALNPVSVSDFQTKGRREGKGWRPSLSKLVGYPKLLGLFGILFQDQVSNLVFYAQSTMTVISGRVSRSSDTKNYYRLGFDVVGWSGRSGGGGGGGLLCVWILL